MCIDGDTSGYKAFRLIKVPFDLRIKKIFMSCREGTFVDADTTEFIKIVTDDATPQTIVAARQLVTADDAGTVIELTVADEGPVPANGVIDIQIDAGASDVLKEMCIDFWCQPVY
jgi:hypothetical protein